MARILLVEPDSKIREFIAGILTEVGHHVQLCENDVEAAVWLATSPIDVLMTDLALSGSQGSILGKNCATLGIRMITLTGQEFNPDEPERERPPALLEKPFRFSDLQRILSAVDVQSRSGTEARSVA